MSERPLRIVFATPSYYPCVGGAERHLQSVAERLVLRGHDVTVVTLDCATHRDFNSNIPAGLPPEEIINSVRVLRVRASSGWLHRVHRWWIRQPGGWRTSAWLGKQLGYGMSMPSGVRMLVPLLRIEADVVGSINWYHGIAFWASVAARLRRIPHVAVPLLHIAQEWAANPAYPSLFAALAGIIVNTEAEGEFVQERGARFITVGGAGAEPSRFINADGGAIRGRFGVGNRLVVGFVGRQDENKGVPTLIDAMRIVWRQTPDAILLLAGQTAHRSALVSEYLQSLSAAEHNNIVYVDNFCDDDGPSIMAACDIFTLPSVEESFGIVLIEAWMCGRPVIAADIPSTRCIVEPGINGLIVRPFDACDLAEKILQLVASPADRSAFGQRGQERALVRHTWDKVTDAWEASLTGAVLTAGRRRQE